MFLQIQKLETEELINKAQKFFWANFCIKLKKEKKSSYNESLVARYLIEDNKKNKKYFSISHKKNLVFIGISEEKIWVDIEIFKLRDNSILEKFNEKEYNILWKKSWKNFYILWTAKEAIIKFEDLKLDDIEKIILEKSEKINKKNSW
jgi:diaminopimelate epimerase